MEIKVAAAAESKRTPADHHLLRVAQDEGDGDGGAQRRNRWADESDDLDSPAFDPMAPRASGPPLHRVQDKGLRQLIVSEIDCRWSEHDVAMFFGEGVRTVRLRRGDSRRSGTLTAQVTFTSHQAVCDALALDGKQIALRRGPSGGGRNHPRGLHTLRIQLPPQDSIDVCFSKIRSGGLGPPPGPKGGTPAPPSPLAQGKSGSSDKVEVDKELVWRVRRSISPEAEGEAPRDSKEQRSGGSFDSSQGAVCTTMLRKDLLREQLCKDELRRNPAIFGEARPRDETRLLQHARKATESSVRDPLPPPPQETPISGQAAQQPMRWRSVGNAQSDQDPRLQRRQNRPGVPPPPLRACEGSMSSADRGPHTQSQHVPSQGGDPQQPTYRKEAPRGPDRSSLPEAPDGSQSHSEISATKVDSVAASLSLGSTPGPVIVCNPTSAEAIGGGPDRSDTSPSLFLADAARGDAQPLPPPPPPPTQQQQHQQQQHHQQQRQKQQHQQQQHHKQQHQQQQHQQLQHQQQQQQHQQQQHRKQDMKPKSGQSWGSRAEPSSQAEGSPKQISVAPSAEVGSGGVRLEKQDPQKDWERRGTRDRRGQGGGGRGGRWLRRNEVSQQHDRQTQQAEISVASTSANSSSGSMMVSTCNASEIPRNREDQAARTGAPLAGAGGGRAEERYGRGLPRNAGGPLWHRDGCRGSRCRDSEVSRRKSLKGQGRPGDGSGRRGVARCRSGETAQTVSPVIDPSAESTQGAAHRMYAQAAAKPLQLLRVSSPTANPSVNDAPVGNRYSVFIDDCSGKESD